MNKLEELYIQACDRVEDTLEIETILRTVRRVDDLTRLLLTKRQRYFLPYLKSNVLKLKEDEHIKLRRRHRQEHSSSSSDETDLIGPTFNNAELLTNISALDGKNP